MLPASHVFTLPAQDWQVIAGFNMCGRIADQKTKGSGLRKLASVRAILYKGNRYLITECAYGPFSKECPPYATGYRLAPESLYQGQTYDQFFDYDDVEPGHRERGDGVGVRVMADGNPMVCASRAVFRMWLPTTRPLSRIEAEAFDSAAREEGWRALWFKGKHPDWQTLNGHPVAVYRGHSTLGGDTAVLIWSKGKKIEDLIVAEEITQQRELAFPDSNQEMQQKEGHSSAVQLALF